MDDSEMKAVANFPQDRNYFKTGSFDGLGGLANNLILAICNGTLEWCVLIATSIVSAVSQVTSSFKASVIFTVSTQMPGIHFQTISEPALGLQDSIEDTSF